MLDQAQAVVEGLGAAPAGFATSVDEQHRHARMKKATAVMLVRLWVTGRLLGPIPAEAWPNTELARLLLPAIERYADVVVNA